jgi:hypothetical protein
MMAGVKFHYRGRRGRKVGKENGTGKENEKRKRDRFDIDKIGGLEAACG